MSVPKFSMSTPDSKLTHCAKDAAASKEREAAISDMNKKLKGVSKTKEIINVCLSEASISIRTALALEVSPHQLRYQERCRGY